VSVVAWLIRRSKVVKIELAMRLYKRMSLTNSAGFRSPLGCRIAFISSPVWHSDYTLLPDVDFTILEIRAARPDISTVMDCVRSKVEE
jgi:hypothetical protein